MFEPVVPRPSRVVPYLGGGYDRPDPLGEVEGSDGLYLEVRGRVGGEERGSNPDPGGTGY